jgi:hypothetical protein
MLERSTARNGQPIARIEGIHLHSSYDPEKEARRFVRQSLQQPNPSMILLLGAGLGYLYREITRSFPTAAVAVVFYHEAVWRAFTPALPPGTYWHPGESSTLLQFLRSRIHELEAEGLAVAEWPASARAFPEASLRANRALHQLFREIRGTLVTTAALGRRWLRNSLANFLGIDRIFPPAGGRPGRGPTVIAASGPSLQEGAGFLAAHRESIELWALPSSLEFLLSRDLVPDTVVMTDPSYYAFSHLQCAKGRRLHLTMPLSAAGGSWRISARVSLVNQETPVERVLLEQAGLTAPAVPAQGTVAATALLLALGRKKGPVIFTGLDFCFRDIFSHVRPNNFENWLAPGSDRLRSLHHRLFALAAEQAPTGEGRKRGSLVLDTYAGWFREVGNGGGRIYRLHPSEIELPAIDGIGESELARLIRSARSRGRNGGKSDRSNGASREESPRPLKSYPSRERRARIVAGVLTGWIERTEQLLAAVGRTASLEPLIRDSHTLSLLYLCNAAEFTATRRIHRLRGQQAAVGKTRALLENHRSFLQGLCRRFSGSV